MDEDFYMSMKTFVIYQLKNLKADENNLLIYQAHPFRPYMIPMPKYIHGVEVYNGNARHNSK